MKGLARLIAAGAVSLTLSACVTDNDGGGSAALSGAMVTEIRVEAAQDAASLWSRVGSQPQDGVVDQAVAAVRGALARDVPASPHGTRPVRLVVRLERVNLASTIGPLTLSSNSFIDGSARLEDLATGRTVAQSGTLHAGDGKGRRSDPDAPGVLSLDVGLASRSDLAVRISDNFAQRVERWLAP